MQTNQVVEVLLGYKNDQYKHFTEKVIPNINPDRVLGVRFANLKRVAKDMVKQNNFQSFLNSPKKYYIEEFILYGMIVDRLNLPLDQTLKYVNDILPYVDNWDVCDNLSFSVFAKNPEALLPFIKEWLNSSLPYTQRYGIVQLTKYFTDERFSAQILELAQLPQSTEFYVQMALGWFYSFALAKHYQQTLPLFEQQVLPFNVHNIAIEKCKEGRLMDAKTKKHISTLKRHKPRTKQAEQPQSA